MRAVAQLGVELCAEMGVSYEEGLSRQELKKMVCESDDDLARDQCRIYEELKQIGRNSSWCK
jgi:hypothetical protein